ncbi:hypothetical protein GCM10010384_67740 [Streptomyces djakartensis]|uniref:DUF1540 domain-containing protein n=1 Tax=Streptomyces djakartensis TaxID=68193 RepID=A0ABQ3AHF4_9ACTN|nr:hypothetical protein GCM10010384_67740 [Streptomyces djakartensis]
MRAWAAPGREAYGRDARQSAAKRNVWDADLGCNDVAAVESRCGTVAFDRGRYCSANELA